MELKLKGEQLSADDLDAFESDFSLTLPESYREFLLESNGGLVDKSWGFISDFRVNCFFELSVEGTLRSMNEEGTGDLPEYLLIANNGGGIYFSIKLDDGGSIWAQYETGEYVKVADSFAEFYSNLGPDPDEEDPDYLDEI